MDDADVVIVGAGVMGASAARALARAGRRVVLLERFEVGHDRGSSHGQARVFRLSYDHPDWVRMMREALPLWRELEEECGERLLTTTGGLDVGPGVERNAAALRAVRVPHEVIPSEEAVARFPGIALPEGGRVLFQADAGTVAAEPAWRAFVRGAVEAGADLLERTPALGLRVRDGRVEVRTGERTFAAETAVVTAGAWTRGLLGGPGVDLPVSVTRETPVYFPVATDVALPVIVDWLEPPIYALPERGPRLKAAEHHAGPTVDPDEEGTPNEPSIERVRAWVAERLPAADPEPVEVETCLYTNTEDERFVLERQGPIVIGSACSGHAFKFAPLVGKRLAELALGEG